ncbi:MAG: type II secretion system F family protein, partial [Planctomycetes bacterium]|nr:type II secretion system F family protein [Planctomycetota bacterium]
MPDFTYRAKMATGQITSGMIAANSHREALGLLTKQSLFPLEVRDLQASAWKLKLPFEFKSKVKAETLADTLTQLSDLLGNGVAMLESLQILSEQSPDPRVRAVLGDVRDAVAEGANLDDAMSAHPEVFSPLAVNMVRAGLEGAFLEESLERVSSFVRKQNELRGKVVSAMTYPALLAIVGTIVAVVLMILVVPMFDSFFERLERNGSGLPTITVILLAVSYALTHYGLVVVGGMAAIVVAVKSYLATEGAQRLVDQVKLKIPIAGSIFHDTAVSRFCRVLGTLLRNGVPILRSLDISSASAGNTLLQEAIQQSAKNISSGNLLSQPLAASGLIPPQVMAMIRVAEESNSLDQVLVKISDRMDQKIERRLEV